MQLLLRSTCSHPKTSHHQHLACFSMAWVSHWCVAGASVLTAHGPTAHDKRDGNARGKSQHGHNQRAKLKFYIKATYSIAYLHWLYELNSFFFTMF